MGLTYVTVSIKQSLDAKKEYRAEFLVDTGATDSMAPSDGLLAAGIKPVGKATYELANGEAIEYQFGGASIEFMDDITFGRVFFGPTGIKARLGDTALASVGIAIDPGKKTLRRLPAIPLK